MRFSVQTLLKLKRTRIITIIMIAAGILMIMMICVPTKYVLAFHQNCICHPF
jgi:hypothetical protein